MAATACQAGSEAEGVAIPLPEDGSSYRMSEICQHIEAEGYDVRATLDYNLLPSDVAEVLDNIPAMVRGPVENYFAQGVRLSIEVDDLCNALNR